MNIGLERAVTQHTHGLHTRYGSFWLRSVLTEAASRSSSTTLQICANCDSASHFFCGRHAQQNASIEHVVKPSVLTVNVFYDRALFYVVSGCSRGRDCMDAKHRKLIRSVIKQVHPDLFAKHLQEQLQNSEALKVICLPPARPFVLCTLFFAPFAAVEQLC